MINVVVPIVPVGQMRARHGNVNGVTRTFKHKKQRQAEETLISFLAMNAPRDPLAGPVLLGVRAYMPVPVSKSKRWQAEALAGTVRPTTKPDMDNLLKHVKDCLTQCRYWEDDKNVVGYLPGTGKYYSAHPRWELSIMTLDESLIVDRIG